MQVRRRAARSAIALTAGLLGIAGAVAVAPHSVAVAAVPRPDHIVVVVEENHSNQSIIGNPAAPYINGLAGSGANFTQFYAETHPSQPNYIAMFSGSTQGIVDDSCPHTFAGPDLGSEAIAAGIGFVGYSEGLPSVGYSGCGSAAYARKHNPWSDFSDVPVSANQPFTAFPSDYSTLPAVSYVVPDLTHDMHDGTIAQGDAWLQSNLDGYVSWAKTHNSVFVLTFDEDDGSASNRIATIITGAGVIAGSYAEILNHYNLLRTIQDAYGLAPLGATATASPILDIWAPPAGNQPPTAAFTASCVDLSCTFDGSASADPDGTVTGYTWAFGDGSTGTGASPSHTYPVGGSVTATLTVADNFGASGSTSHVVTPTTPTGSPFVSDSFNRTVRSGLGTADTGGAWSTVGTASGFSVSPSAASLLLPKAPTQLEGFLGPAGTDADLAVTLGADKVPVGGPLHLSVTARRVGTADSYFGKVLINPGGAVTVRLSKRVAGVETVIAGPITVSGLTYSPGTAVRVRVQATGTGPTVVRARVWAASRPEPTTWQLTASDSTAALQAAGTVGVTAYLSGAVTNAPVSVTLSSVVASATAPAANQPPVAAFTSSCATLTCSFDGSGSSDPDGNVVQYAWDFGDGSTGSGAQPTHAFAIAGAYRVTLTVTDNRASTASTAHTVTATAPAANQPPVAAFTSSCTALACSFDGTASTDGDGTVVGYAWDFGDATTGSGATPTHSYAAAGTYPVRLSVTDNDGSMGTVTHSVTVSPLSGTAFATDSFARTVSAGWGTADVGGTWSLVGSAARASVSPGSAALTLDSGMQIEAYLAAVSRSDADVATSFALNRVPVGGPVYVTITGRRVGSGNAYVAKVLVNPGGAVTLRVVRQVAGAETVLAGPTTIGGLSYAAGQSLSVRVQVSGSAPTTVRARLWAASSSEPTTWQVTGTDSTSALQAPGSVGVIGYVSRTTTTVPVTVSVTAFTARPTTG